jgi:hypothetical protein
MAWRERAVASRPAALRATRLGRAVAVMAGLFTLAAIVAATAAGDDRHAPAPMAFNIPRQSLATALQAYSTVTGAQLLYESAAATGRVSTALEGTFTRDHALRILLTDTDLMVRYTRANSITLAPASIEGDEPPAAVFAKADLTLDTLRVRSTVARADAGQLRAYEGVIQADIQQALKKDGRTRNGSYSAGIKLWIDGPRTVRRTELFRSSGDLDRDGVIGRLLDGLVISQAPPANTPQPVLVMITVRSM